MLATFCLRLACGLIGSLLLLSAKEVNPRFFRVHFLIVLGLIVVAAVGGYGRAGLELWLAISIVAVLTLVGSIIWSLEGSPGGRGIVILTLSFLVAALAIEEFLEPTSWKAVNGVVTGYQAWRENSAWHFLGSLASAALLGTATSAMLMGHSYLIALTMSLRPLLRLLVALFLAVVLRMIVAGIALWSWSASHSLLNLEDETVLWLPVRWGLGFVGPLVLGWMAWRAARIRSTQSATGILYVVVIFCFVGELTSQLLEANTGFTL
jgi:hypothetical protein